MWFPWTLSTYHESITRNAYPSLLNGSYVAFSDAGDLSKQLCSPVQEVCYKDFWSSWGDRNKAACAGATVVKTEVARAAGGYATHRHNAGDIDFLCKLGTAPGFVRIYNPVCFAYRQHEGMVVKNHEKVLLGMLYNIEQEKRGRYPGGQARRLERLRMLSSFARSASVALLKAGESKGALNIYLAILGWNLSLLRLRYLLGFPLMSLRLFLQTRRLGQGHESTRDRTDNDEKSQG